MFCAQGAAEQLNTMKPKSYNQFTSKFDNNALKMGLRA